MDLTPEERQRIYEQEKARLEIATKVKSEAKRVKSRRTALGVLLAAIFVVILLVTPLATCPASREDNQKKEKKASLSTQAIADLNTLRESGLVKHFDGANHEALVEPALWRALDIRTKQNIAAALASACEAAGGQAWVEIKDNYSGKVLAKYSRAFGYTVKE